MRKRYISLDCTQAETAHRLKQLLRVYSPRGIVEENYFKIYKKSGLFLGNGIRETLYSFRGNDQQSGKTTYISYQVRPGLPVFLFFLMLGLLILLALYEVIVKDKSLISAIILLSFGALGTLIIHLKKKKCIEDFEKQLSTEIHY